MTTAGTQVPQILAFPFAHKGWKRKYNEQQEQTEQGSQVVRVALFPVDDVNAPDLYIPFMAFMTFILLSGLLLGTRME